MMVDEPQTYEEPSLIHVIEVVLSELELEETMPIEACREGAEEGVEEVPEPFIEEIHGGGHLEEGAHVKLEYGGSEVQLETEDVDEEPHSVLVIMRADAHAFPPPRVSHILPASAAPGSTSSSCHYSLLKSTKAAQSLARFLAPIS